MSSADVMQAPSPSQPRLPIGQTLYTTYLDAYTRRLKRGVAGPPADAAGLVNGTRYHGRSTPVKGKGAPPPDQNEQQFRAAKHFVDNRSFQSARELLHHHADADDSTVMKPCCRLTENSFRSNLAGGSAYVTQEPDQHRPARRPGTAKVTHNTQTRVFSETCPELDQDQAAVIAYYTSVRNEAFACRPTTAPPRLVVPRSNTEARRLYEQCRAGHADVIQYRHSGGICPDEYKLVTDRPNRPQLESPKPVDAKTEFFDARRSYDLNRIRSLWSSTQLA